MSIGVSARWWHRWLDVHSKYFPALRAFVVTLLAHCCVNFHGRHSARNAWMSRLSQIGVDAKFAIGCGNFFCLRSAWMRCLVTPRITAISLVPAKCSGCSSFVMCTSYLFVYVVSIGSSVAIRRCRKDTLLPTSCSPH